MARRFYKRARARAFNSVTTLVFMIVPMVFTKNRSNRYNVKNYRRVLNRRRYYFRSSCCSQGSNYVPWSPRFGQLSASLSFSWISSSRSIILLSMYGVFLRPFLFLYRFTGVYMIIIVSVNPLFFFFVPSDLNICFISPVALRRTTAINVGW